MSFLSGKCINFLFLLSMVIIMATSAKKKKSAQATSYRPASSNEPSLNPLWDDVAHVLSISPEKRHLRSYLFANADPQDMTASFIQDIIDVIHAKQNPPKEDCSRRRLEVLQMASTSFEGTGSLLKQVLLAVAISMHSNRTMIWGLGLPFIFEHTREIWNGQADISKIRVNNEIVDCQQDDPAAGPLGCFFEPLSVCSLEDAAPAELIAFSENPHNDSARILMSEMHRGVALYHPPKGLFDLIFAKRKYPAALKARIIEKQSYIWASAVAAFVFRIKPALLNSLTKKYDHLFPISTYSKTRETTWGMHIRHGDLKALSNIYSYKEVFEFDDYFAAGMKMSHTMQESPKRLFVATDSIEADELPEKFDKFMANRHKKFMRRHEKVEEDDEDEDDEEEEEEEDEDVEDKDDEDENDDDEVDNEDDDEDDEYEEEDADELKSIDRERQKDLDSYLTWYSSNSTETVFSPSIFTISNQDRYRTEHGSHTVAANGGCLRDEKYQQKGMRCALNYEAIIHYQTMEVHRSQPRSLRLMRVLLESIEDLYLLSHCDAIVAQGSSHFSTLAALLIWARTLGYDDRIAASSSSSRRPYNPSAYLQRVYFLDDESIRVGFTPTGFLHGMNLLNGTNSVDTRSLSEGARRWQLHLSHFLSFLPSFSHVTAAFPSTEYDPTALQRQWSVSPLLAAPERLIEEHMSYFHLGAHFPQVNTELFYLEAQTWLGNNAPFVSKRIKNAYTNTKSEKRKTAISPLSDYVPSLPGHCPGKLLFPTTTTRPLQTLPNILVVYDYIAQTINMGVDQLNMSHTGQAMQCWTNAKHAIITYPEIFSKKVKAMLYKEWQAGTVDRNWGDLFKSQEDAMSIVRDNMGFVRIMRYAEMAINENRNTREYYKYTEKYMERPYDGVNKDGTPIIGKGQPSEDRNSRSGTPNKGNGGAGGGYSPEGNKLFSLEDVNEEIIRLEEELTKMKALRDKLVHAHYMYMNGKIEELKKQENVRQLPSSM